MAMEGPIRNKPYTPYNDLSKYVKSHPIEDFNHVVVLNRNRKVNIFPLHNVGNILFAYMDEDYFVLDVVVADKTFVNIWHTSNISPKEYFYFRRGYLDTSLDAIFEQDFKKMDVPFYIQSAAIAKKPLK